MSKDVKPHPDKTIAAGASAAGKPGGAHGQDEAKGLGRAGNEKPLSGASKPSGKPKP